MTCPYYHKVTLAGHSRWVNGYCTGDKKRAFQIPSLFEETHYCSTMQYPACPLFRGQPGQDESEVEPHTSAR